EARGGPSGSRAEPIAHLSDEGLRRNYLNKVPFNREIIAAWLADAAKHRFPRQRLLAPLAVESNVREPFQRLADTGLRLNALHTVEEIQAFIVEEATELSGADRVVLVNGPRRGLSEEDVLLPVACD